jgi:formate hydrogenlyase transcriptional activator
MSETIQPPGGPIDIIGDSAALRELLRQVATVAGTDATVLIRGETGTGKELIARDLHLRSGRTGPFVKVNCAAIPSSLLESELFGHEKGAFTGAVARRIGRFELAHNGTLFLDEIGELPLELQPKLLRVLQEREFERVGSCETLRTDARLVAATHRDLGAMVDGGAFRADLYYRLDVFPIHAPALRDRPDDIALLAHAFARRSARRMGKDVDAIAPATLAQLRAHSWPGNIRELENVIERAVIRAEVGQLVIEPADLDDGHRRPRRPLPLAPPTAASGPANDALDEVERAHIITVLEKTHWVVGGPNGAAVRLGIKRSTLNFRMKKLGIARCVTMAVQDDAPRIEPPHPRSRSSVAAMPSGAP